ncbi:MAG TPA: oligosaccharide flippase family protein [Ferruginibacter sp.]|nr:oligosaccharide flippase family protein [Ferruginibacter sp.]HMP19698.1 oligosaccharide flippase family protein [Ferruginibacter sp.]
MTLFNRFKKDYVNYLISVIIPVCINALSIPLFKRLLGAEKYGRFAILFNALLLLTAALSGWITQSVIRHFPTTPSKANFFKKTIVITFSTQLIFAIPVFLTVWQVNNDCILGFLFSVALITISVQFSALALSQSLFLSKKNIFSEFLRSSSYLIIAIILLVWAGINYLYALFTATLFSYALSVIYLLYQTRLKTKEEIFGHTPPLLKYNELVKKFLRYGGPLSMWYIFAYLMTLADKYFMQKNIGGEIQGNYQAVFDFASKSITLIISPVITSLFPLLTSAYEGEKKSEIVILLKRILLIEAGALVVAVIVYWWFGYRILFSLLQIPPSLIFKQIGLLCIVGTFIWQMAIVVHKRYELKMQSRQLMVMAAAAFGLQLTLYLLCGNKAGSLIYPAGYVVAASAYLFLVSFSPLVKFVKMKMHTKSELL